MGGDGRRGRSTRQRASGEREVRQRRRFDLPLQERVGRLRVWVTTPEGLQARKWLCGKTREEIYDPWVQLKAKAAKMPIPTSTPTVAEYLAYWLEEVIKPNREDNTYSHYELMSRLHIIRVSGKSGLTSSLLRRL